MSAEAPRSRPLLVLVGGAPGTGKTTLACRLGDELALPVLWKDFFKESLAEALQLRTSDEVRPLGPATFALLYRVSGHLLAAGVSLIVESNFHHGVSEQDLRPLVSRCRAVLIHCELPWAIRVERVLQRAERGERHWAHFDRDWIAARQSGALPPDEELYAPLALDVPILHVDTSEGYAPDFAAIVDFIRSSA